MKWLLISIIKIYQKLSSFFYEARVPILIHSTCRFYPTCSDYAIESIQTEGVLKGLKLSAKRLSRCHPFS